MNRDLLEIVSRAVCGFNVEIDKRSDAMVAVISKPCQQTCDYCRLMAEHICKRIEEGEDDQ